MISRRSKVVPPSRPLPPEGQVSGHSTTSELLFDGGSTTGDEDPNALAGLVQTLMGTVHTTGTLITDQDGVLGYYYAFPELYPRTPGVYRLQLSLFDVST